MMQHFWRAVACAIALAALGGAAASAEAASFDCHRAASSMEHMVCNDPKLSALDDQLGATYADMLALSLDPAALRDDEREWLASMQKTATAELLAQYYGVRLDILHRELAEEQRATATRDVTEREARNGCLAAIAALDDDLVCKLAAFADIGSLAGHTLSYATYTYAPKGSTADANIVMSMRVVVFERRGAGALHLLFAPKNDGGRFDTPKILHTRFGDLLHLPGWEEGTGNFNRERLFVWRNDHWRDIDTTAWLATLQQQLPKGLGAWKGIFPDYTTMSATTPLWRASDGNCCPTSGKEAVITLSLSGDRIAFESVRLRRAKVD